MWIKYVATSDPPAQSSEGLWLACCQENKNQSSRFYSYFLGPRHWHFWVWRVRWNDLAALEHWTQMGMEGFQTCTEKKDQRERERESEREWAVMTTCVQCPMCWGCEWWHFQNDQWVCSLMWCRVFTKFSRTSSTACILMLLGVYWNPPLLLFLIWCRLLAGDSVHYQNRETRSTNSKELYEMVAQIRIWLLLFVFGIELQNRKTAIPLVIVSQ